MGVASPSRDSVDQMRPPIAGHVESRLQRTSSLRPYVSPILEKLTDTPFAKGKQLSFRFKVEDAATVSAANNTKPIVLASVSFARQMIRGTLHVRPDLQPYRVFVRYTCDGWASFTDQDATFLGKECYFFSFNVPSDVKEGTDVAFVFAAQLADRSIIWDNNNGNNYCADVLPQSRQCTHASTAGRVHSFPHAPSVQS